MAIYSTSKEILRKNQANLNKIENQTKQITDTANSLNQDSSKMAENKNSVVNKLSESSNLLNQSLTETSSLLQDFNKNLTSFHTSLSGLTQTTIDSTSLLASNLVSLVQINSVLSAFRADFIMAKNGKKIDGTGYYDKNLILKSLSGLTVQNPEVKKILQTLRNAANYANKASNTVRGRIGNSKFDREGENSIVDKLLGGAEQFKGLAGLGAILGLGAGQNSKRGKLANKATKLTQMDTSSIGGMLESILSDKSKSKFLNPLRELGMDLKDKNDPFSQWLGNLMGKYGLAKDKAQKESDPNLVSSALAPFADDIKDMVEFKYTGLKKRPTSIPDYATPVWIVNSTDQTDHVKNKNKTHGEGLENQRIDDILMGIANNTKDKYGRDLLTYTSNETDNQENEFTFNGTLAGKLSKKRQQELNKRYKKAKERNFKNNHENLAYYDDVKNDWIQEESNTAKAIRNASANLDDTGILQGLSAYNPEAGLPGSLLGMIMSSGGTIGNGGIGKGINAGKSFFDILKGAKNDFRGSHAGGKKRGKGKGRNKIVNFKVHPGETIMNPTGLQYQEGINKLVEINSLMLSSYTPLYQNIQSNYQFLKYKILGHEMLTTDEIRTNLPSTGIGSKLIKKELMNNYDSTFSKIGKFVLNSINKISGNKKDKDMEKSLEDSLQPEENENEENEETTPVMIGGQSVAPGDAKSIEKAKKDANSEAVATANADIEADKERLEKEAEAEKKANEEAQNKANETIKKAEDDAEAIQNKAEKEADKVIQKSNETTQKTEDIAKKEELASEEAHHKKERAKDKVSSAKLRSFSLKKKLKLLASRVKNTTKGIMKKVKARIGNTVSEATANAEANVMEVSTEAVGAVEDATSNLTGAAVDATWEVPIIGPPTALAMSVAGEIAFTLLTTILYDNLYTFSGDSDNNQSSLVSNKATNKSIQNNKSLTQYEEEKNKSNVEDNPFIVDDDTVKNLNNGKYAVSNTVRNKANVNDPTEVGALAFLSPSDRKIILNNTDSPYAKLLLNSKDAGNIAFLMSNGAILAGLGSKNGNQLNDYIKAAKDYSENNKETQSLNSKSSTNKHNFFGNLLNSINKTFNVIRGEDISKTTGDNAYSENLGTATLQAKVAKGLNATISQIASLVSGHYYTDENGNPIFTSTAAKTAQNDKLFNGGNNTSSTSSTTSTETTTTNSSKNSNSNKSKTGKGRKFVRFKNGKSRYLDPEMLNASKYAISHGYKEKDGGTYPQFFNDYLRKSGISVQNSSLNNVKNSLLSGKPVILMGNDPSESGKTPFGAGPHYVVATGMNGDKIRVIDSESPNDYDEYNANSVLNRSTIKLNTSRTGKGLTDLPNIGVGDKIVKTKHTSKNNLPNIGVGDKKHKTSLSKKIKAGKGNSVASQTYNKTVWCGDSRTEGMRATCNVETVATLGSMSYTYMEEHYDEVVKKEGYNIFCWWGINGASSASGKATAELYNRLASDLKGKSQVFAGTAGNCYDSDGSGSYGSVTISALNNGAKEFNDALKSNLSNDVKIIDVNSFLETLSKEIGVNQMTVDNVHYTSEVYKKVNDFVNKEIGNGGSSPNNNNNNSSTAAPSGTHIGDLYVKLSGYVNADEIFDKYLGKTVKQKTVSNNNITEIQKKEIEKEVESKAPTKSVSKVTPTESKPSEVYNKNGTTYVVNNIEYGVKTNIKEIMDEFELLNQTQDDALDVLNTIYKKVLIKKGKSQNTRINGYDYSLKPQKN